VASDPEFVGRYRVLGRLGEGHFGVVWLAEARFVEDGRPQKVAIKQLSGEWSLKRFETLVQEFELLAQVKHPSICRVFEFLDRESAVVLEYVDGVTLRRLLEAFEVSRERVWPDVVARIGQELADCLYRAHDLKGLVHRDVKPENVMITPRGDIKLLDFGLAVVGEGARRGGGKGTPLYMAPEQARGEQVTHASDLFALGLVLYELLTGAPAYPIPTVADEREIHRLYARIESGDVGGLAALRKDHGELGTIVAKCLAPDPRDRHADGRTLMLALGDHARRASLGAFAAFAWEGPLRPASPPPSAAGTLSRREAPASPTEGSAPVMAKNPEPIRPAGAPPGGGSRPRPQPAARPPARPPPKMFSPGEAAVSPASTQNRPAAPPPGEDLAMVPLANDEGDEVAHGKSSTSFFSLPKPRKVAAAEDEPIQPLRRHDALPAGGIASGPVAPASPPPGAYAGPQPVYAPMTPMQAGPVVPLGIQGPVAGGMHYGASPHSAQVPPDLQGDVQRAQSYRVFAVVLGLIFMVLSVLVVTVTITVGVVMYGARDTGPKDSQLTVGQPLPPPPPPADTGDRVPDPPPVVSNPKPPRPGGGTAPAPRPTGPKPPPPPPPPSADPAQATVSLAPGSPPFTAVEVRCQVSGFRDRADFVGGTAKIPGVPREECDVFFKGGPPAKARISGGQSKTCSFQGVAANCQ
jgi:serine/threonine protein kinase